MVKTNERGGAFMGTVLW